MKKYHHRHLESKILDLFEYFPVVAVLGARQVGKSTLIQHLPIDDLQIVTFDPVQDVEAARQDPDFFLQNKPTPLFLDEVQYAPELLASIKRRVDKAKRKGMYILSGSQNLATHQTISESLAGRVAMLHLHPMSTKELNEKTDEPGLLENILFQTKWNPLSYQCGPPQSAYRAIWRGGFPGLLDLPERFYHHFFESYLQTYIERDVRTASQISSLQSFGHFIGLLAALTGQEINHNQLGRDLGIDRKTAKAWTEIAISTFQWYQIPAYSLNAVKRIAGKPKGYFADTGFACTLQRISAPDVIARHPLRGHLFETFVVMEIVRRMSNWSAKPNMYHYRAYSGAEIDLVMELNGVLIPIEIKMKTHPTAQDCRSMDAMKDTFPRAEFGTGIVISSCESVIPIKENVFAIPWWEL